MTNHSNTEDDADGTKRGARRHRRAVDPGRGPEQVWHSTLWEDDDRAWGGAVDEDDERILRERPPHWG